MRLIIIKAMIIGMIGLINVYSNLAYANLPTYEIKEVFDKNNKDINMFVNKEGKILIKSDGYDLVEVLNDDLTKKPKIFSRISRINESNKKIKRGYEYISKDEFIIEYFDLSGKKLEINNEITGIFGDRILLDNGCIKDFSNNQEIILREIIINDDVRVYGCGFNGKIIISAEYYTKGDTFDNERTVVYDKNFKCEKIFDKYSLYDVFGEDYLLIGNYYLDYYGGEASNEVELILLDNKFMIVFDNNNYDYEYIKNYIENKKKQE